MTPYNISNIKNRKKIFDFISENPGLHLRKIIELLDLSEGTIRYHINYLVKRNLIFKDKKRGYTRFYVTDSKYLKNKKIVSYLRNENTRAILLFFCFSVCGSLKTISKGIDKDKKEVSGYIEKLLRDNILEIAPVKGSEVLTSFKRCKKIKYSPSNREKVYRLKNPYELHNVIISLKNKYFDDGTTKGIINYLNWMYKEKNTRPKTIISNKETIENIEKMFYELFPLPFCF